MPYSWHPMYKITYVVLGQAPTLKCALVQFSEVSLQSVKVKALSISENQTAFISRIFYFKDILLQRFYFKVPPNHRLKCHCQIPMRNGKRVKYCHVLSPWSNLLMTFLSFPSACFFRQGGDYFPFKHQIDWRKEFQWEWNAALCESNSLQIHI